MTEEEGQLLDKFFHLLLNKEIVEKLFEIVTLAYIHNTRQTNFHDNRIKLFKLSFEKSGDFLQTVTGVRTLIFSIMLVYIFLERI